MQKGIKTGLTKKKKVFMQKRHFHSSHEGESFFDPLELIVTLKCRMHNINNYYIVPVVIINALFLTSL
jgi:hypothetical protein